MVWIYYLIIIIFQKNMMEMKNIWNWNPIFNFKYFKLELNLAYYTYDIHLLYVVTYSYYIISLNMLLTPLTVSHSQCPLYLHTHSINLNKFLSDFHKQMLKWFKQRWRLITSNAKNKGKGQLSWRPLWASETEK